MEIELVTGDITTLEIDAIVTAANSRLAGGGGVDGAVHRAAGRSLVQASRALAPCPPGGAVVTDAFDLAPRVRWVVHAVGPRFGIDEPGADLLASAYTQSLARADEVGAASVAFPSISTGVYGYPLEAAAQVSVAALRAAATRVARCVLVAFDERTHAAWRTALEAPPHPR
ncbi:macro domain-containing protein [Jatrophihabitans fulvus]